MNRIKRYGQKNLSPCTGLQCVEDEMNETMPKQTTVWIETPLNRKCQCEEGCPLSLEGYRKNCKIHPFHRAKYDQKLREQKREAIKELRYKSAKEYSNAHPYFLIFIENTITRFIKKYAKIPSFRYFWEYTKWSLNSHPNDHWMAWYKKQLQEWKPILKIAWQSRRERWTGG